VELGKHKRGHPYRVVDNTHYPVFAPDWTATEELLMLSGRCVDMDGWIGEEGPFGFGVWRLRVG
jgi:hypothetical protein